MGYSKTRATFNGPLPTDVRSLDFNRIAPTSFDLDKVICSKRSKIAAARCFNQYLHQLLNLRGCHVLSCCPELGWRKSNKAISVLISHCESFHPAGGCIRSAGKRAIYKSVFLPYRLSSARLRALEKVTFAESRRLVTISCAASKEHAHAEEYGS